VQHDGVPEWQRAPWARDASSVVASDVAGDKQRCRGPVGQADGPA
jgi:hypothetical protein